MKVASATPENRFMQGKHLIILSFIALSLFSCRSTKTNIYTSQVRERLTIKDDSDKERIGRLIQNALDAQQADFHTWSAKMSVDAETEGDSRSFTAHVRMVKDSIIWISLTGMMSIEAARVKITPDSLIVLNKLENSIFRRGYDEINRLSGLPISFSGLQGILLGQPLLEGLTTTSFEVREQPLEVGVELAGRGMATSLILEPVNLFVVREEVRFMEGIKAILKYGAYAEVSGKSVAMEREVKVEGTRQLMMKMKLRDVLINEVLSFPFSIPQNYTEI